MSRWSHDLKDVKMQILRHAGEPIPTWQINQEAEKIYGDEWSDSTNRNLSAYDALRSVRWASSLTPKHGHWGLMPDADSKFAPLKDLTDDEVFKEHMKVTHG